MTKNDALKMAIQVAKEHGWPWIEPVQIKIRRWFWRDPFWIVKTNCEQRGCNVYVEINDTNQSIIKAVFWPR